jgi:nucleotide-binding universal stress UspA family protein
MVHGMSIVFGTDFSERSRAAAAAATLVASRLSDPELWLVHVLDPAIRAIDSKAFDTLKEAALRRLQEQAESLKQSAGVAIHCAVINGSASDGLLEFAADKQATLIIVTSPGHGDSPLYRVGGTSERLVQSAEIPVLVVRDPGPFEAWANGKRRLRVLLAVDWTESCEAAIRWVKRVRRAGPCDVVVGYVYYSDFTGDGAGRYGLPWRHSMVERDLEAESLLARDLASRVGDLGGEGDIVFRAKHGLGRRGDHLLELAEMESADLIVVGTHHRRGVSRLESVAGVTLHYGHASVAIVPVPTGQILAPDEVPTIRSILVPTDLSSFSSYAVPYAYTLLGERGGEVRLLHVLPPDAARPDHEVLARLRALVPGRGVPDNVSTHTEVVRHAGVARAIGEAAERLGADAICMGSHGRGGLTRAVVGSVTEDVMRKSHRPVFVIRPLPP